MSTTQDDILLRLDRIESRDEIRQLISKYSLALDMRDLDAMAGLFVPDVKAGRDSYGRQAFRDWLDDTMRKQFDGTSHHVGTTIIELTGPDEAVGIVYSKNEHETGPEWVIMQMMYYDHYKRVDGRWCFARRQPLYWYATDLNNPPIGSRKMRWPGREPYEGSFHALFPSWKEYWDRSGPNDGAIAEPAPLEAFIETMRRGQTVSGIRVR
ncbi:nuclear transport factor 2 family protein [Primorskyibacter marinus]|uniref:nuclear transport factor 2 family protein n=1 Tax=Primorskyibacter marinus TaxID=1977320 RepID=UPI000E300B31|nr:nuclear transport factor 2 family protein [Primorskyibacter marinus]